MGTPPHVGIDLLEPNRLVERLQRNESLGDILFTDQEREYCAGQLRPEEHLAARFCAKEAVIKALGIDGWDPLDVEIVGGGTRRAGPAARRCSSYRRRTRPDRDRVDDAPRLARRGDRARPSDRMSPAIHSAGDPERETVTPTWS